MQNASKNVKIYMENLYICIYIYILQLIEMATRLSMEQEEMYECRIFQPFTVVHKEIYSQKNYILYINVNISFEALICIEFMHC